MGVVVRRRTSRIARTMSVVESRRTGGIARAVPVGRPCTRTLTVESGCAIRIARPVLGARAGEIADKIAHVARPDRDSNSSNPCIAHGTLEARPNGACDTCSGGGQATASRAGSSANGVAEPGPNRSSNASGSSDIAEPNPDGAGNPSRAQRVADTGSDRASNPTRADRVADAGPDRTCNSSNPSVAANRVADASPHRRHRSGGAPADRNGTRSYGEAKSASHACKILGRQRQATALGARARAFGLLRPVSRFGHCRFSVVRAHGLSWPLTLRVFEITVRTVATGICNDSARTEALPPEQRCPNRGSRHLWCCTIDNSLAQFACTAPYDWCAGKTQFIERSRFGRKSQVAWRLLPLRAVRLRSELAQTTTRVKGNGDVKQEDEGARYVGSH
jgi:hypothetical protein